METPKEVNQDINLFGPLLDYYYIDYSKGKYSIKHEYNFDKNGIPILEINGKLIYQPVYIAQFALGAYDYYLNTKDIDAKNIFIKCADWFKGNLKKHGRFYYWEYNFEIDAPGGIYGVPWFSAMAQGQGASVLLRAFSETKDEKYLQAANKAIRPIFYDVSVGGLSVVKGNDYIFPQEYPTDPPSDILNGAIYTYFGVNDYYRVTGDPNVKNICDIIVKTFANELEYYDTGYWSLYARWPPGRLADHHYNSRHITQLRLLYLITGNKKFFQYSHRFEEYHNNWMNRTKCVFLINLEQIKRFGLRDVNKLPAFLKEHLRI